MALWSTARTSRRSVATGACCASSCRSTSRCRDTAVDLVVESDDLVAQLDVLRLECVDGGAYGAKHHGTLLLKACLEGFEALLVLDACHRHQPNLPVT